MTQRDRSEILVERHDDRGQSAVMLLIVAAALGAALLLAVVDFGGIVQERARAQTAADAAALASLDGGRSAAEAQGLVNWR